MKRIDNFFNILFLILISFYSVLLIIDTVTVLINPTEHITSYGLADYVETWKFKSVTNYVISNIAVLAVLLLLIALVIMKYRNKKGNKLINIVYYISLICFIIAIVYGYYQWSATGFDH